MHLMKKYCYKKYSSFIKFNTLIKIITSQNNFLHYIKIMRLIWIVIIIVLLISCSAKYKGPHSDYKKFSEDIEYCLKKSCKNKNSVKDNFSIISSAFAYGGGGGGGGGGGMGSSLLTEKISYKTFNLCLKEKGYIKDKNGMFEMPRLSCD